MSLLLFGLSSQAPMWKDLHFSFKPLAINVLILISIHQSLHSSHPTLMLQYFTLSFYNFYDIASSDLWGRTPHVSCCKWLFLHVLRHIVPHPTSPFLSLKLISKLTASWRVTTDPLLQLSYMVFLQVTLTTCTFLFWLLLYKYYKFWVF